MLRYALYCRKSKKEDGDTIKSIDDQRGYWEERAAQQGLLIAKLYEENESAMFPGKRPVWRQMITDLEKGRVDAVLVWSVNRLSRNHKESGEFAQLLSDGIIQEVRTPNSRYVPTDNILPLLLEQGTAAQSSKDLSSWMKLSAEQQTKGGGWPHRGTIGYLNVRDPNNSDRGIVVPDPERFELVKRGLHMMLTGLYSMRQVIDAMNSWGLRTRKTKSRPSTKLSYSSGYQIFGNPFYAGFVRIHGVLYPGNHAQMLTAAEYAHLQEVTKRFRRMKGSRRRFTYTGMMRCGLCGYQVVGELRLKGGRQYIYYHCSDPRKRCTKRAIPEHRLECTILDTLKELTIEPKIAQAAGEAIRNWLGRGAETVVRTREQQQERLSSIDRERAALLDLVVDGTLRDKELYNRKDAQLVTERANLTIAVAQSKTDLEHIGQKAQSSLAFATTAAAEFVFSDHDRKRAIADALGFKYTLKNREVAITPDPLLEKMVTFAHQKTRPLEPGIGRSQSQQAVHSSQLIYCGGGNSTTLEPSDDLIEVLRDSDFPNLFGDDQLR